MIEGLYRKIAASQLARDISLLFLRIGFGAVFFRSYQTKVEDGTLFDLTDTTFFLFEEEYAGVPIPADIAAPLATYAEFFLPLLLLLGLGTRVAAAGLVIMTLVIQIFVYPDAWWNPHMSWVAMGLILIVFGPGRISLDHLIGKVRDRHAAT
ncbi:MAG: DoxX family protein [Sphingomonadaceae bacterium]|nr:MAG: DoxX family protein [Sphingomonadaceae bacterium]